MGLEDVLSDKEPEQTAVEAPAEPEEKQEKPESLRRQHQAKENEARGRRADGTFLPKEEPKEEKPKEEAKPEPKPEVKPPPQEMTEKERAFLRAAEEERRKRQELERRLEALEKRPEKPEDKKTFWDDPEGHFQSVEKRLQQREQNLTLRVSEQIARSKYQDFDASVEVFADILKGPGGQGIHAQWLASQDPAEFAYRMGKQTKELREAGNIDALRAKIEKETREKLEAEYKKKQEDLEKERKAIPPSLSDVRGGGGKGAPAWSGPPSLDEILK